MTREEKIALKKADAREKFALRNGKKSVKRIKGKSLWIFTYSSMTYPGNTATYSLSERRWV